jgi:dihydrofolate reductase
MIYGIAGVADNKVIGSNGKIPWHYAEDMKFFKERTINHPIVMGRKTYDSFGGKPLKDRLHLVLTNSNITESSVITIKDKEAVLAYAKSMDVYIIGGNSVWSMFADDIDEWLITRIHESPEGDTLFDENVYLKGFKEHEKIMLKTLLVDKYVRSK